MAWLKYFIFCSILFSFGYGFLTQTNPPTSQNGSPSTSQLQQALMYVSDSLSKETTSRKQLEQLVLNIIQDMAKLKQQNQRGLLNELMSLNKSVDHLNKENQALKYENANLTLEINNLKQETNAMKQQNSRLQLESHHQANDITALKQNISALKQQEATLQHTIYSQAIDINNLKVKEASCRRDVDIFIANMTGSTHSAFCTRRSSLQHGQQQIVLLNEGDVYDKTNGHFTCKKDGLYVFSWVTRIYDTSVRTHLTVNGNSVFTVFPDAISGGSDDATGVAVVKLRTGDIVKITVSDTYSIHGGGTSFCGWNI